MKPAPFEYHRPETVEAAVELLAEHPDAEVMAGNQSLGIVMGNRLSKPDHVVDVNRLEALADVEVTDASVSIGAIVRHRAIERSAALATALPIFPEAAEQIAGPSVRSRGTLGGSLGEADPAGNYPTVVVALDASIELVSTEGRRSVPAREYFFGYMLTEREETELIAGVTVDRAPFPPERTGMAFTELKPVAQTWPTVGAAAAVRVDDPATAEPVVEAAWLAVGNAADVPLHVPAGEAAVVGEPLAEEALEAVDEATREAAEPTDELHADAQFKREVAGEYARRAVETAYDRARSGA